MIGALLLVDLSGTESCTGYGRQRKGQRACKQRDKDLTGPKTLFVLRVSEITICLRNRLDYWKGFLRWAKADEDTS